MRGGKRASIKGCILTDKQGNLKRFHPLIKVDNEWEEWFIKEHNIQLCELYYPPFNFKRTGCRGCPFSLDLQEQLETMDHYLPNEKKQREQERREKAQAEWIKSDHTEQANEIKRHMTALKVNYILPLLDFSKIMERYAVKTLNITKNVYQDLEKLLNFDEYTAERWQERKNNILNDWDFNKKIIDKKLFDVVACKHMYIKAADGQYIMIDKYKNDPCWGKHAQAF